LNNLTDQQKGSLLAFIAVIFITPDSLFIRLSNVDTWGLVFYRGIIPFFTVFLGMLIIYKLNFFKILLSSGYHGLIYVGTFSITNITFVVSIQNTNVANTLVMIATAPMLSAILGAIFLKEPPDKKTWISIIITFIAIFYIFFDSLKLGNFYGDILGFITAIGLAVGAVTIRSAKSKNLVPASCR
jgi:EamA-like transporter family.